jgi:DNA-binding Lrp family transcriptional regulator
MKAYVLVNARAGKSRDVVNKAKEVKGVKSAYACWGRPDVFVFVDVGNEKALAETVLNKLQEIDGIESTETHIVIE